jgi:hypothetical protein
VVKELVLSSGEPDLPALYKDSPLGKINHQITIFVD